MQVNIDLSNLDKVFLPKFFPLLKDKHRFLILRGSAGSGKSVSAVQKMLLRILIGYKTNTLHNFLCVRKTANSIRESTYAEIKRWITAWNLDSLVEFNKSNLAFEFSNGSRIISVGCDDAEKLKSLSGVTSIFIEEASQLSLDDFKQINLRLRGISHTYMQIMLCFNPISRLNWLYDYFYVKPKDNATLHHSTWRDNKFLDETYRQELQSLQDQDKNYWMIYSEGEFGSLTGCIYNNYIVLPEFPESKFGETVYGVDFGFSAPSSVVKVSQYDEGIYLEEKLYEKGLTNTELIKRTKDFIPEDKRRSVYLYGDTAEPDRIAEFNKAGFIMYESDKSVKSGIDFLRSKKLYIKKDSINLLNEIQSYIYKVDKENNSTEEPLKMKDHCMDAMRYASYSHFGSTRMKPQIII
jgi:phage terminase large subunit